MGVVRLSELAIEDLEDQLMDEVDEELIQDIENRRFSKMMKKKPYKKSEEVEES